MTHVEAQDYSAAKQFLITRIIEQASADGVPLSNVEKTMLSFSELSATPAEMATAQTFERDFDSDKYEAKMARLIRRAYYQDKKSGTQSSWNRALIQLSKHDLYLLVLIDQAKVSMPRRKRELARAFLDPKFAALAILGLGGLVFFVPIRSIDVTPLDRRFVHSDFLTFLLFVFWIAGLWLIGKIAQRG